MGVVLDFVAAQQKRRVRNGGFALYLHMIRFCVQEDLDPKAVDIAWDCWVAEVCYMDAAQKIVDSAKLG